MEYSIALRSTEGEKLNTALIDHQWARIRLAWSYLNILLGRSGTQGAFLFGNAELKAAGRSPSFSVHVITRKRLNDFAEKHPASRSALSHWYRLVKRGAFRSFAHLRETFPSADLVGNLTVFNIGGNKVRTGKARTCRYPLRKTSHRPQTEAEC